MRWIERTRSGIDRITVGVAAGLVYLSALANGFVFDDLVAIKENPIVSQPKLICYAFSTDYWHGTSADLLYRPLTTFSFALNHLVHGMRPLGFHLVNVLLHVLVSLTVYRVVRQLCADCWLPLLTALLFAVHPIHTDAVASIVGRAELLMALFTLIALSFYIEATSAPQPQ